MLTSFEHVTPESIRGDPAVLKSRNSQSTRKRRPHSKSRRGCGSCRKRHLKCDEQRPECGQCLHGMRSCAYTISPQTETSMNALKTPSTGNPDPQILTLLENLASESHDGGVDSLELLDHFVHTTEPLWMGSAQCQNLLQRHTPRLALESPFLLHAILAISAYHIATVNPEKWRHELAGAWHYSLALQFYRSALNDKSADVDALFGCCMLLTLLSFKHISDNPNNDNVPNVQKSIALNTVGIRFLRGPRILSDIFTHQSTLDQGIWKPLVRHCEDISIENDDKLAKFPGAFQSITRLEALCHGDETSSPFHTAIMSLRLLMQSYISSRHEMIEFTYCFAIQLDPRFLSFVEEGVPKALLVLCYWYALVVQVDQWWACDTAQTEGLKLLHYLQDTTDLAVKELLNFPAELLNERSLTIKKSKFL